MNRILLLSTVFLILTNCKNESEELISLSNTLDILNQIQSASYNSTFYGCYPGDTIPIGEKKLRYFNEYTFPSDTSVGAVFVQFDLKDTSKMVNAYDGRIKASINWEKYHYITDDFSKNTWPYRVVMPPFFTRAKAIIEYSLSTGDSITIDTIDYESSFAYKISIFNERIEFVGKLPIHISQLSSNEGIVSEYILWINKATHLPFKFQRSIPNDVMVESINNLETNKLKVDFKGNFNIRFDKKYIASCNEDYCIRLWDLETQEMIWKYKGEKMEIQQASFSPDGKYIIAGTLESVILVWKMESITEHN